MGVDVVSGNRIMAAEAAAMFESPAINHPYRRRQQKGGLRRRGRFSSN